MHLSVRFPDGGLVAEVEARSDCPFAEDPATGSFVLGSFTQGPAFPRLRVKLDAFLAVFDTDSLAYASALHEEIDRLGLVATDPAGRTYRVWNVLFQEGGLLFQADPSEPA